MTSFVARSTLHYRVFAWRKACEIHSTREERARPAASRLTHTAPAGPGSAPHVQGPLPRAQLKSHFRVSACAGMTLYQVLRELQIVLAVILGACPLCRQPVTLNRLAAALTPT